MADNIKIVGDCAPSENFNPKMSTKNARYSKAFVELNDPIAEEIKEFPQVSKLYDELPIVPFFDNGDATLMLFRKLKKLSPTHGGCINNIRNYVVGGQVTFTRKTFPGIKPFEEEIDEIDKSEWESILAFILTWSPRMNTKQIQDSAKEIYENLKIYGNAFLRIDRIEIAGQRFIYFQVIDAEMCRYLWTEPGEDKVILISPIWTYDYINDNPPEFVSAYPEWSNSDSQKSSTIIHLKNHVAGRSWYGEPDSSPSLYYQYSEVQLGQFTTEGYASDFIPRVLFDVPSAEEGEDDEEDDGFDTAVTMTFTNQAVNKKRVIVHRRKPSDEAIKVTQFQSNSDYKSHESNAALAERQIIKSHDWHSVLMGVPVPGKLGMANEFMSIYRQKYLNVILPLQVVVMDPINTLFDVASEWLGDASMSEYNLALGNLYEDMMSDVEEGREEPVIEDAPIPEIKEDE